MAEVTRGERKVEDISVEREGNLIYMNMRTRRPRGKKYYLRKLILTEDQARDLRDELINSGLE